MQKTSLTALYKAISNEVAGSSQFLECVDVCLGSKVHGTPVENAMEFVSRAVFVKDDFLMEPCLKVR